jgi:hypothetical protein
MDRIVWHCLEKRPERRFRSAHDLAFALRCRVAILPEHDPAPGG